MTTPILRVFLTAALLHLVTSTMKSTINYQELYAPDTSGQTWVRRAYHGSTVTGNYVYIDGGEVAVGSSSSENPDQIVPMNQTLSIDLTQAWNVSSAPIKVVPKPSECPTFNSPRLWYDSKNKDIYSFGGELSMRVEWDSPELSVWKLIPDGSGNGSWIQNTTSRDPPFSTGLTRPVGGGTVWTDDFAFYLGGYSSGGTSAETKGATAAFPDPGLITYNMNNGTWSNNTAPLTQNGTSEWSGVQFAAGLGSEGLMVTWGGDTSNAIPYNVGDSPRQMSNITIYDPSSQLWYHQNATGDRIPSTRELFCSVAVSEEGSGSTEIFMYGGYNGTMGPDAGDFDQIWILTLPAFHWLTFSQGSSARIGHTCEVVGDRQMLSIGGLDASNTDTAGEWAGPDNTYSSLAIYDMTKLAWNNTYDPNIGPYKRPDEINQFYQQNGPYPAIWTQPELEAVVKNNSSSKNNSPSSPSPVPPPSSKNNTAAEIGGALGGIALLALLLTLALFFIRRRSKAARASHGLQHPNASIRSLNTGSALGSYAPVKDMVKEQRRSDTLETPYDKARLSDPPQAYELMSGPGRYEMSTPQESSHEMGFDEAPMELPARERVGR